MKIEYPMKLTFMLEEENNIHTNTFVVEGDTQWTELVVKFADFLNSQYGYEVKEKLFFVSDFPVYDWWSVVGEHTISREAFKVAQEYDEKLRNEDDEEETQQELDIE